MDEETKQLLREILAELREIAKAGQSQVIYWPLLALVTKWKLAAVQMVRRAHEEPEKQYLLREAFVYQETAKDLEEWIRAGILRLEVSTLNQRPVEETMRHSNRY